MTPRYVIICENCEERLETEGGPVFGVSLQSQHPQATHLASPLVAQQTCKCGETTVWTFVREE